METEKEINILLLGQTGVGKSTFINAFSNFINFKTLKEAAEEPNENQILIGTKFAYFDDELNEVIIQAKKDSNESKIFGESQTRRCRSYNFDFGEYNVRIIDTPGIENTKGKEYYEKNIENILKIINQFEKLHAICILINPIENRLTDSFKKYFKSIFEQLHKSVSRNIVFVYTHAKAVNYEAGNAVKLLKDLLDEVKKKPPKVEIKLERNNLYFIDSEAFNVLVYYKKNKMYPKKFQNPEDSWDVSSEECLRMMNYIASLEPHNVHDTLALNTTRRLVKAVVDPLAEITSIIDDNMTLMKKHKEEIKNYNRYIDGLRKLIQKPRFNIELIELTQPKTVCTGQKCIKIYNVGGYSKYVYDQSCCNPCTKDHVGWFWDEHKCKFDYKSSSPGKYCSICDCPEKDHKRISSENRVNITRKSDQDLEYEIVTLEDRKRAVEDKFEQLKADGNNLAEEKKILLKSLAKFDFFLKSCAYNDYADAFKETLEKKIERNKSNEMAQSRLKNILREYESEKKILEKIKIGKNLFNITLEDIKEIKEELCTLANFGDKISQIYVKQEEFLKEQFDQEKRVKVTGENFLSNLGDTFSKMKFC